MLFSVYQAELGPFKKIPIPLEAQAAEK